jgi:hypothetical protein
MTKVFLLLLGTVVLVGRLLSQSAEHDRRQPEAQLVLVPGEPLTEPHFPKRKTEAAEGFLADGSMESSVSALRCSTCDLQEIRST